MSDLAPIRARLNALCRRERLLRLIVGGCLVLAHVLIALALFVALDLVAFSHFEDPSMDRLMRSLALLGVLGWLVWAVWTKLVRTARQRLDAEDMALRVEAVHPELQGRLISALQLSRPGDRLAEGASASLVAGLIAQARTMSAPLDLSGVIDARASMRLALMASGALLMVFGIALWRHEESSVAAQRLFLMSAQYPTAVRFLSITGDLAIAHGGKAQIAAELDSRYALPSSVTLVIRPIGGRSEVRQDILRSQQPGPNGGVLYVGSIEPVIESLEFRALAGDARWPQWSRITVASPPAIVSMQVVITPPAYTALPPTTHSSGDINALIGSQVEILLRLSAPFASTGNALEVQFANASAARVAMTVNGSDGRARFTVLADGTWSPQISDAGGMRPLDPGRFRIRARVDRMPSIELLEPSVDQPSAARAVWPVGLRASDDLGISNVSFVWQTREGTTQGAAQRMRIPGIVPQPAADGGVEVAGRASFDLGKLALKPGMTVTWWLEVEDNRDPQAQSSKSTSRVFTILTPEQVVEALDRERADLLHRLGQLRDRQLDGQNAVNTLRSQNRKDSK